MATRLDMDDVRRSVEQAKREINADIENYVVPVTVGTFGQLHDYVDANTYGGLCDEYADEVFGDPPDFSFANEVQERLHLWIKAGRP